MFLEISWLFRSLNQVYIDKDYNIKSENIKITIKYMKIFRLYYNMRKNYDCCKTRGNI